MMIIGNSRTQRGMALAYIKKLALAVDFLDVSDGVAMQKLRAQLGFSFGSS